MSKRKPSGEAPGAPSSSSHRTSSPSADAYIMSDPRGSPGSRPGSPVSPRTGSPRPPTDSRSPSRGPAGQPGYPPPMGKDPARLEPERKFQRVELPADAYSLDLPDIFAARPKAPNSAGQAAPLEVNQYKVTSFDFSKTVHQYAVSVSPLPAKVRPVLKKLWRSKTFASKFPPGVLELFITDHAGLAWSSALIPGNELRALIDLDEGKERSGKGGQSEFYIILRKTTEINMRILQAYINQQVALNNAVLEAINFVDHLLRQGPSERLLSIKRNFYNPRLPGRPLMDGAVVEVHKGLYWSGRISASPGSIGLAINADVANTAFFVGNQDFVRLATNFLGTVDRRLRGLSPVQLEHELRPVSTPKGSMPSEAFKQLRKLSKLKFTVKHVGRPDHLKDPIGVQSFSFDARHGPEGATAKTTTFEHDGKTVSVEQYFLQKYNVRLRFPNLPGILTGRGSFIPLELAILEPMQRYPFKLNPQQVQAMVKIAVTKPRDRKNDIVRNVGELQIGTDRYLNHFGLKIESEFSKSEARVLPSPTLHFQGSSLEPRHSGRWIIQGKKFWKQNSAPLQSWSFIALENCVDKSSLQRFAGTFRQVFQEHGGKCSADSTVLVAPGNVANNAAEALLWAFEQTKAKTGYPQIIFAVLPSKGHFSYERVKKSADCRFGILTQCLAAQGVQACQRQLISNVAMKVHSKLGGATSRTMPPWASTKNPKAPYFPPERNTVIVGVDISHPAPGAPNASVAAMTMSVDPDANRYAAACQTNGKRTEMLTSENTHILFGQLIQHWKAGHGGNAFPQSLVYFRDGVSTGEYAKVLDIEVEQLKSWFRTNAPGKPVPKITTIICTKRHHVRFFPRSGDRNGNPMPGTMMEKDVVNPRLWEFYLCSHAAIIGTSRPGLYTVLRDEMGYPPQQLQAMIYEQVYSYARSTTPVSIHPAVYYAHLAGSRARHHENLASSVGPRTGGKGHEVTQINLAKGASVSSQSAEALPLLPLGGQPAGQPAEGELRQRGFIRGTMWFI